MDTDTYVAICATLIAFLSLAISLWGGIQNRKHNRLSLRPHLRIDRSTYKESPAKITLVNDGVGPAVIKKFNIYCNGEEIPANKEFPIAIASEKLGIKGPLNVLMPTNNGGSYLTADKTKDLLVIKNVPNDIEEIKDLRNKLRKIDFIINYESIYGETFTYYGDSFPDEKINKKTLNEFRMIPIILFIAIFFGLIISSNQCK